MDADLHALGRLGALLVRLHHGFDPARFIPADRKTPHAYASFFATQLRDPNAVLLVAERGRRVIGYAYAGVEGYDFMALRGPAGVAHDIVVDPKARAQGVGRMLLHALLGSLKERGVGQVVLWVARANKDAQRLFSRAGFRQTMVEMTYDVK